MRSFSANIYYLYLIKLAKWLMLIMPVVVLFYTENGLDSYQIYLLQAAYSLSVAIFEIPSGYVADVIGRRTTLIWGTILGTAGFSLLSISYDFSTFLIAEIILGIGGSFISGADSALLYDSLKSDNRQHYYLRYEGRITAMGNLGETLAALGGGLLAVWLGYRSVYAAQALVAAIGIPAALLLVEPLRKKRFSRPSLGEVLEISRQALFTDRKLGGAILAGSVAGTATLGMAWTAQVYFVDQGFTEKQITPLWVLLNLVVGGVSLYAGAVVARLGTQKAILISSMLPAGFILLGILPLYYALIMLIVFYLIRGYTTPMFRDLINQNCDSSVRATVLSIRSLLVRLLFSFGGPAIGYFAGLTSLRAALVIFGLVLGLLSLLSTAFFFKHHHLGANGGEGEDGSGGNYGDQK